MWFDLILIKSHELTITWCAICCNLKTAEKDMIKLVSINVYIFHIKSKVSKCCSMDQINLDAIQMYTVYLITLPVPAKLNRCENDANI